MRERIKKATEVNQKKLFLRPEKPIAKQKLKTAKHAALQAIVKKHQPVQQFKSNLEILHKRKSREEAEASAKATLRKSMYSKHRLAKSIAKQIGL